MMCDVLDREDQELLKQYQSGNCQAFAEFYGRAEKACHQSISRCRDDESVPECDRKDCTQKAMIYLADKVKAVGFIPDAPRAWVRWKARNAYLNKIRDDSAGVEISCVTDLAYDAGVNPETSDADVIHRLGSANSSYHDVSELRIDMNEALATLTPKQQQILKMRAVDGCSLDEIAEHFGMTKSGACRAYQNVQKLLREHLSEYGD